MKPAMLVFAALTLAGCAAQQAPGDVPKAAAYEERYVPTGTLFSTKDPKRSDRMRVANKEEMEQMLQQSAGSNGPSRM